MFYEEKIINGVLHSRSTPAGEWFPVSKEVLADHYMILKEENAVLRAEVAHLKEETALYG